MLQRWANTLCWTAYTLYGALGITTQGRGNEGRNENPPRSNAPALGQHAVLDRLYALYGALVGITTQERGNEGKT